LRARAAGDEGPTPGPPDATGSTDTAARPATTEARGSRRWRHLRLALSLGLLGVAIYFLVGRTSEIANAWQLLGHLLWRWVGLAVLFEAASMVVFARMQRWLLRAGGVEVPLRTMVEITLAGNAMAATLPGGVAWAGAWVFGQLRRRGVSRFLRVWVFLVAGAVSSFALFIVVAGGIELAGSHGPVAGLRWGALALAAIPIVGLGLFSVRGTRPARAAERSVVNAVGRVAPGAWALRQLRSLARRLRAVQLSRAGWAEVLGLGLLNWLDDCAVLVACLLALHVAVPWRGIFVVYGLTQVAAAIPITPGGIGVVEGTLGALLHAYGVPVEQAVATVVLYRVVSFWGLVPVGWGVWVALDLLQQRGRRRHAHPWAEHRHPHPSEPPRRRHLLPEPQPCPVCAEGGPAPGAGRRAASG
jgi:uncharacterized membrane protein YbhN (UPF0104 family)